MSDKDITIFELKQKVQKFCEDRNWDQFHSPKDLIIGVITEAGELLEPFRFKSDKEIEEMLSDKSKRDAIGAELADVLYFLIRFSQRNNFDLSSLLIKKLAENDKKYPIGKAKDSNKKYTEL
jgi:NTP pyrophosphatase (non-canonical NTP hydrolase)